jgi:tripartite-type tricarboxylate transporter receptor subunit TctC
MAGHVDLAFLSGAKPLVEEGKLLALGVSSAQPFPTMPKVPPLAQEGLPGFAFTGWHGVLAPAKTPPEIIAKLNQALGVIQKSARLAKVMQDNGASPAPPGPPEELAKAIHGDMTTFRRLVVEKKIKLD